MSTLPIDRQAIIPTEKEIAAMWKTISFQKMDNWSDGAKTLKENLDRVHENWGSQFHKFKVQADTSFDWCVQRNRLGEINFAENFFKHKDLSNYRTDLGITTNTPIIEPLEPNFYSSIFQLPEILAVDLLYGSTCKNTHPQKAWEIACNFVNDEFWNRFLECRKYEFIHKSSDWFFERGEDRSILIFDTRNYEIVIIDITGTD